MVFGRVASALALARELWGRSERSVSAERDRYPKARAATKNEPEHLKAPGTKDSSREEPISAYAAEIPAISLALGS
jgi:hypothetical protein